MVVISVLLMVGRRRSVDIVVDGLGSWYVLPNLNYSYQNIYCTVL